MIHGAFAAMGTTVEVWSDSERGWQATRDLFEDVEQGVSRFRPQSELSRVNRDRRSPVPVSPRLGALLLTAARIKRQTAGLIDVGLGRQLVAWGYDRTFSEVSDLDTVPSVPEPGDWEIDRAGEMLTRDSGVEIDLGGIAKGWTADLAVESGLARVVSAGGDIRSDDPDTTVQVEDPRGGTAARVVLGRGALATSSTMRRSWRVGARRATHILDPRTASPVRSPIVSASVTTETAVDAEAGAKTVLLMGEDGLSWADECAWIRSALVVWENGSIFATNGLTVMA